jgi:hypothetical protein
MRHQQNNPTSRRRHARLTQKRKRSARRSANAALSSSKSSMTAREYLALDSSLSTADQSNAAMPGTTTSGIASRRPARSRSSSKSGSKPRQRSKPEQALTKALASSGLPAHVEEHRFHGTRKWRFDFAWPDQKVALEVEGGVFSGGRHVRGAGFKADCEKYNTALRMGWRVLRYVPGKGWIEDALSALKELL